MDRSSRAVKTEVVQNFRESASVVFLVDCVNSITM